MQPEHADFTVRNGEWRFNWRLTPGGLVSKVRFAFDDSALLDECPYYTKVGENADASLRHAYIGFSYVRADQVPGAASWAKKFPFAELITNLDRNGVSTSSSKVTRIK